jgi:heme o synthase
MSGDAAALAGILFLWQFPHFFALSWMYKEDYSRGGFQMVSVNDPTGERTANLIWRYSWYLAALPPVASLAGLTSHMFAVEGVAISSYLLFLSHKFRQDHSNANARKIFLCSLWYLPVLLFGFVFHSRNYDKSTEQDVRSYCSVEMTR